MKKLSKSKINSNNLQLIPRAFKKSKARRQGAFDAGNPATSLKIFSSNITAESLRNFSAKVATILFSLLLATLYFILTPSPVFATNTGQFTAEVWVKPTSSIASQALLGKAEELRIFTDASGFVGCQIKATTWQTAATATTNALILNTWAHVACAYDKANIKVYVNGTQVATVAQTNLPDDTANAFKIGQDDSADTPYSNLTGTIDNFQFYNYARSAKQVVQDMEGGSVIASGARQSAIGYWKFDEGQGTTANNSGSQGQALQGTLTGMSSPATATSGWTNSGKFGKALIFDGSDDYVDLTDLSTYDIPSSGSVFLSAWVKTSSATAQDVFSNYGCTQHYYNIAVNSTGVIYFNDRGTTDTSDGIVGIKSINDGNWHHIAAGRNGTTGKLEIYVDGVLDKQQSVIHTDAISPTVNGSIGRNRSTCNSQNYFNGSIDEVKIYNYALTSDEIKTDYNKGSSLIMGAAGNNTTYAPQAANQDYCVPGDTTSCVAPVGEWNFEEGSGTSVKDTSGNNNTGTWYGTGTKHWDVGKVGKGGKFNGTDDYVSIPDSDTWTFPGDFTMELWFKRTSAWQSTWYTYNTWVGHDEGGGWYNKWLFAYDGSASRFEYLNINADNTLETITGDAWTPALNNWYHVALTRNGSVYTFYKDGVSQSGETNAKSTPNSAAILKIGTGEGTGGFNGLIEEVKIYNYARTPAQIAWDYNRGAPVGHWQFDECQGSVAHDISDNSNHGTITIGASGEDTLGTCTTSSTAWGSGATGKYNSSLSFDGTDDYVSIPSSSAINLRNNLTVTAWFKLNSLVSGNYAKVFTKRPSEGVGPFEVNLYNNGTNIVLSSQGSTAGAWDVGTGNTNITTGTWYQVVFVYDANNLHSFYVNGVLKGTQQLGASLLDSSGVDFWIGRANNSQQNGYALNGQIDDVKVFNYALTPLQIKNLYNNGAVFFGPVSGSP